MNQLKASVEMTSKKFPMRYVIGLLGVLACILLSSTRYNLSVAIVSMVKDSCTPSESLCSAHHVASLLTANNTHEMSHCNTDKNHGRLNWSEAEQGLILGVYYYGYAATHIFGGRLAEKHGPKWVTVVGLCGAALLNALLPISAKRSFTSAVAIRVLCGAFHGVVHPALFFMFNNWFSKKEQSTALSLLLSGTCLGLVVNVPITLFIKDLAIKNGWSLLFYGGSLIHIIWLVLWLFLVSDIPERHKFIQDKEIFYIRQNSSNILELNSKKVPWRKILQTKALYASIVAKICWSFNHAVVIDNGPSYLNRIHGYGMYQASTNIAVVYLITSGVFLASGPLFPVLVKHSSFSNTRIHKIFQSFVFIGSFVTMFILPNIGCDRTAFIVLLVINMATQGLVSGGEYPLINEFSGQYSGTVYGIAMTFDSLARFIAPIIRGELVKQSDTLNNWNIIFYITAALNVLGLIVFETCASANLKKWAVKRDFIKQISNNGSIEPTVKKELKKELQNPNFRLSINTNSDDWKEFKSTTIVP